MSAALSGAINDGNQSTGTTGAVYALLVLACAAPDILDATPVLH